MKKTAGGVTTDYVYDEAGHLIGEYTPSGGLIAEHIWLNNRPVGVITSTGLYYVQTDQLGAPRVITNSSKTIVWQWHSDPFGNGAPTGSLTYNLRLPGQYYDAETGKNYNYFRDYDPTTGRYIESDPIGLNGGINTYAYTRSNPITLLDRVGLNPSGCKNQCNAQLPSDSDVRLLAQLIFAEATRNNQITIQNSNTEMAAIAYTVINRADYLLENDVTSSFFGATDESIQGVVTANQFAGFNSASFNLAGNPGMINTGTPSGKAACAALMRAIATALGSLTGTISDPYVALGGVYAFRTAGSGPPGGSFYAFSQQIPGSGNTFYGLSTSP